MMSTSISDAESWAAELRATSRIVVTTNGCFDLFHAGHLDTLRGARALGNGLIVLLNSDISVKRLKGPQRPYLDQAQRTALLVALRVVDHVVIFDEDTPMKALEKIRPDIHVKGGSFEPERVQKEDALLKTWGGSLVCLPLREGTSTSALLARIWADRPAELAPKLPAGGEDASNPRT